MPTIDQHHSNSLVKLLLVGQSGDGKTGALAALANAGYTLWIYDFDNGLDIVAKYTKPEFKKNIHFQTFSDKMAKGKATFIGTGGKSVIIPSTVPSGTPIAFASFLDQLDEWKEGITSFGSMSTWGPKDVAVIDSLSFCSEAAMRLVLAMNAITHPRIQDYGMHNELIFNVFEKIKSDEVKCNIIVCTHIKGIGGDDEGLNPLVNFPSAMGRAVPQGIGKYFNCIASMRRVGSGPSAKQFLCTGGDPNISLKHSATPGKMPLELPISTGLADYFKILAETIT